MPKVMIIAGGYAYSELFKRMGFTIANHINDADIVLFTGGEDVSPSLYGDRKHQFTNSSQARDDREGYVFEQAKKKGIPMVGICRGGQFLNVMSGGRMYQHVESHTSPHEITDLETGEVIYVSSTHHQMMMPGQKAEVIAISHRQGGREWYDGQVFMRDIADIDYEVLFYPETKCLCFQPHPEFNAESYTNMHRYFQSLLDKFVVTVMA